MAFEPVKLRAKGSDVEYFANSPVELVNRIAAGDTVVPSGVPLIDEGVKIASDLIAAAPANELQKALESDEVQAALEDKPKPGRPRNTK